MILNNISDLLMKLQVLLNIAQIASEGFLHTAKCNGSDQQIKTAWQVVMV